MAIAVDHQNGFLFWANNAYNWKGIYRSDISGSNVQKIVFESTLDYYRFFIGNTTTCDMSCNLKFQFTLCTTLSFRVGYS